MSFRIGGPVGGPGSFPSRTQFASVLGKRSRDDEEGSDLKFLELGEILYQHAPNHHSPNQTEIQIY